MLFNILLTLVVLPRKRFVSPFFQKNGNFGKNVTVSTWRFIKQKYSTTRKSISFSTSHIRHSYVHIHVYIMVLLALCVHTWYIPNICSRRCITPHLIKTSLEHIKWHFDFEKNFKIWKFFWRGKFSKSLKLLLDSIFWLIFGIIDSNLLSFYLFYDEKKFENRQNFAKFSENNFG